MKTVTVRCRAPDGAHAPEVFVEVHVGSGLPGLSIVGLVETAVKESRDRVRAALQNSGFSMPDRRIIVSLAPADLPKSGSRYDLAIAIGILCASQQLPDAKLDECEFIGELALSGALRPVPGVLPVAVGAIAAGRQIVVPAGNEGDAQLLGAAGVLLAQSLTDVGEFMQGAHSLAAAGPPAHRHLRQPPDLSDVSGQLRARRALEIAATGAHHLLLSGPPGTGKSMLAERLPGILPPPARADALETAAVYSLKGISAEHWPQGTPPFRAPHHTASAVALAGGGSVPAPGEISLAHNGVLFLDELPEFKRSALEVLREPLERGVISIARSRRTVNFPARLQLIAAMNPCPCGYQGDPMHGCRCTPDQLRRYKARISGPLLDRIDIAVDLAREPTDLFAATDNECSSAVRQRVCRHRQIAVDRGGRPNAALDATALQHYCTPDAEGRAILGKAAEQLSLSRRACNRSLRVARTIADLADCEHIGADHIAEALSLRPQLLH